MRSALARPLALLAVGCLPALPAAAAPSAGAEEAAAASFPLATAAGEVDLQLVAEPDLLVLELRDGPSVQRVSVALEQGQLALEADRATLSATVAGLPLEVVWQRTGGSYAVGGGTAGGGPTHVTYRGDVGEGAAASLQLAGGSCDSRWGSLGRSVHVTTDDTVEGDPAAAAELLRDAACGGSAESPQR